MGFVPRLWLGPPLSEEVACEPGPVARPAWTSDTSRGLT